MAKRDKISVAKPGDAANRVLSVLYCSRWGIQKSRTVPAYSIRPIPGFSIVNRNKSQVLVTDERRMWPIVSVRLWKFKDGGS